MPSSSTNTQPVVAITANNNHEDGEASSSPALHQPEAYPSRVLVILNPFGGQRKALELWRRDVEPMWREAGILFDVVVTERAGHAIELAKKLDLNQVRMLALGGGDGIVSEAIHGLLLRADKGRALCLPLLHLPMGTGNALAASICYQANISFPSRGIFCKQVAEMALRPAYHRLHLYRVEFGSGECRTMFLSLSWGLMADIDLGSERFRFLGMARLHLEAFIRVAFLRPYRARISYLPLAEGPELADLMGKLRLRVDVPRERFGPTHFDTGRIGGEELNKNIQQQSADENNADIQMPPMGQPVPGNWRTLEGQFCFIHLAGISHLGSDLPFLPCARLEDRFFYLTFVQWPRLYTRVHMARILLSYDTSDHLADSAFEIIPVLACRVEPEPNARGMLALDGEPAHQLISGCNNGDNKTKPTIGFQVATSKWNAIVVSQSGKE